MRLNGIWEWTKIDAKGAGKGAKDKGKGCKGKGAKGSGKKPEFREEPPPPKIDMLKLKKQVIEEVRKELEEEARERERMAKRAEEAL